MFPERIQVSFDISIKAKGKLVQRITNIIRVDKIIIYMSEHVVVTS